MKKLGLILTMLVLSFGLFLTVLPIQEASADTLSEQIKSKTSNTVDSSGEKADDVLFKTLDGVSLTIRLVGVILIVIGLTIAGINLGISNGNAAKRGLAIGGIITAIVAIVVVAKAPALASWALNGF